MLEMHVTHITLGVHVCKQNLNAGLLQEHHFWARLRVLLPVAVLLPDINPKLKCNTGYSIEMFSLNLSQNDVVIMALHSDFV